MWWGESDTALDRMLPWKTIRRIQDHSAPDQDVQAEMHKKIEVVMLLLNDPDFKCNISFPQATAFMRSDDSSVLSPNVEHTKCGFPMPVPEVHCKEVLGRSS